MKRHYYYLIAGLPDLAITANELPFSLHDFRQQMQEQLQPADYQLFTSGFASIDNFNLIRVMKGKEDFDPAGNFSREELELGLSSPENLPAYMREFLEEVGDKAGNMSETELELKLFHRFVDAECQIPNPFLRDWLTFNNNLRNLLVALNCRKFGMNLDQQVMGSYEIAEIIRKNSKERDFGLGGILPYALKVVSYFEEESLYAREFFFEQLRWAKLDELLEPYYFSIEVILAYAAKLRLIKRRIELPEKAGKAKLHDLLNGIRAQHPLPEVFT
ncbi:MAG: DUF2764 family protein [Bacteroidetes bacterium]|nr:MAG: DUF2764 family protein [Bacteroidota bacterium]